MKVYIGKYIDWIGPYQIAEWVPFLNEDQQHNLGTWLASTWLNDLCEWLQSKRNRKIMVRIDKYDTWSMDHTLAYIILPMLKQLKETKYGSPFVDDEDLPAHMRHGDPDTHDNWVHYKWDWVLNEMIFAFESKLDDSWQDKFHHGDSKIEWELISGEEGDDNALYESKQTNPDYSFDIDGYREYSDRIANGFRLFGKYYQGLWD
jgi:hypothetical protein